MKKYVILIWTFVLCLSLFTQCTKTRNQESENERVASFSSFDTVGNGFGYTAYIEYLSEREEGVSPKAALWMSKDQGEKVKLFETHLNDDILDIEHLDKARKVSINEVYDAFKVYFVENTDNNQVYIIIEGTQDNFNTIDYIAPVSFNIDSLLLLPVFDGFEKYCEEDNTLIFRGRGYLEGWGRYIKKYKYDFKDNCLFRDSKMYHPETGEELIFTPEQMSKMKAESNE